MYYTKKSFKIAKLVTTIIVWFGGGPHGGVGVNIFKRFMWWSEQDFKL